MVNVSLNREQTNIMVTNLYFEKLGLYFNVCTMSLLRFVYTDMQNGVYYTDTQNGVYYTDTQNGIYYTDMQNGVYYTDTQNGVYYTDTQNGGVFVLNSHVPN